MSYVLVNDLAGLMFNIFGNGAVLALVIIAMITILMLTVRAPLTAILAVNIPLILGFILAGRSTNMIYVTAWVYIPVIIIAGLLFAYLFILAMRG